MSPAGSAEIVISGRHALSDSVQQPHTVSSYDVDLHNLRSTIGQMGALCEAQLTAAIDAIAERDAEGAAAVVSLDARIDTLHVDAEGMAIGIIARYAPLADDLREVVATLKIAGWLERVGDYAKSIAKRAMILASFETGEPAALIVGLATEAKGLLRQALDAYIDRDEDVAASIVRKDEAIDRKYAHIFDDLLSFAAAHDGTLVPITHLQFIAKNLERIADQATNIAEQVRFAVAGTPVVDRFDR